ncbi:hypothetical protein [uncultured Mobiluncus sp.]
MDSVSGVSSWFPMGFVPF